MWYASLRRAQGGEVEVEGLEPLFSLIDEAIVASTAEHTTTTAVGHPEVLFCDTCPQETQLFFISQ